MTAEVEWGEWLGVSASQPAVHRFRALASLVWEHTTDRQTARLLGQCFAHLTSYGRYMMRRIRTACPTQSVISQDTDGLWVTEDALPHIPIYAGVGSTPPGCMRIVTRAKAGQWYSPKHYWTDAGWVLAGYHDARYLPRTHRFADRQTLNPVLGAPGPPPAVVRVRERHTSLSTMPVAGIVSPEGWVYPRLA